MLAEPVYYEFPVSHAPFDGGSRLPIAIDLSYRFLLETFNFDSVAVTAAFLRSCIEHDLTAEEHWNDWEPNHLELLRNCGGSNSAGLALLALPLFHPLGGK